MSFDRFAKAYHQNAHFQRQIAGQLALQVESNGLGLDLGSGTGFVGQALATRNFIEVDRSAAMLACSSHGAKIVAAAEALPFRSDCFDWVVSSLALQWVGRTDELLRVLRPGGRYYAAIVLPESLPELAHARRRIGLNTVAQLPQAQHWQDQLPGQHRIETVELAFDSPREALASVRDIGAGGSSHGSLSRAQHRQLLDALGRSLTYQILWIQGVCE